MDAPINLLTEKLIGAAIEVHRELGPGLLESAYHKALEHELRLRGIPFESEKPCAVSYKGTVIENAYRLDLLVDNAVVIELKTVEGLTDIHEAQLLTYLKFTGCRIGLLFNFNATVLTKGLRRLVR
jgi:GxxExxY protein